MMALVSTVKGTMMPLISTVWIIMTLGLHGYAVSDNSPIIGIDLGTSFSCVGVMYNSKTEIIANDQGNRVTPSYVALSKDGTLVGEAAKNQAALNPKNTAFQVKRIIGRKWSEAELQEGIKKFPFQVTEQSGRPYISLGSPAESAASGLFEMFVNILLRSSEESAASGLQVMSPEQISGIVLSKMKQTAEMFVGQKIKRAVITVPAYFNDAQRQATKIAAKIAGLEVMRIVNEPTAAAIAYYGGEKFTGEKTILVFDLGGGTFDVSVIKIIRNRRMDENGTFKVLATNGDMHLGGEDFDNRVTQYFINMFNRKYWNNGEVLSFQSQDPKVLRAIQRLRQEVEKGKKALSSKNTKTVRIDIDNFYGGTDFTEKLTRAKFEELNNDLFKKVNGPLQTVLKDANLQKTDIDEVLLVGGSSKIPKIRELVKDFFEGRKDPVQSINPDETVALGAAILAGEIAGEKVDILQDVIPMSLGINICYSYDLEDCDNMDIIIPKNTHTLEADFSNTYTTIRDNQDGIEFKVYEGEDKVASENNLLGKFTLTGIKLAPRGATKAKVNFKIDEDGILHVTAKEIGTNNKKKITITGDQYRLTSNEILMATKYVEKLEIEEIHDEL